MTRAHDKVDERPGLGESGGGVSEDQLTNTASLGRGQN